MKIRTWLLYHMKGLTWHALKEMDYREYFGLIRELTLILEAQPGGEGNQKKQPQGEMQAVLNQFPQPQEYEGETIRLI